MPYLIIPIHYRFGRHPNIFTAPEPSTNWNVVMCRNEQRDYWSLAPFFRFSLAGQMDRFSRASIRCTCIVGYTTSCPSELLKWYQTFLKKKNVTGVAPPVPWSPPPMKPNHLHLLLRKGQNCKTDEAIEVAKRGGPTCTTTESWTPDHTYNQASPLQAKARAMRRMKPENWWEGRNWWGSWNKGKPISYGWY